MPNELTVTEIAYLVRLVKAQVPGSTVEDKRPALLAKLEQMRRAAADQIPT